MARATVRPALDVAVTFSINEAEARALDALAGYGDDAFINAFYEKLGESYMKNHERGLREFLKSIREIVNPALCDLNKVRRLLKMEVKGE